MIKSIIRWWRRSILSESGSTMPVKTVNPSGRVLYDYSWKNIMKNENAKKHIDDLRDR